MHSNGPLPQVKRRIGYHDEKEEDEEDIPDAARKVDDGQEGHS